MEARNRSRSRLSSGVEQLQGEAARSIYVQDNDQHFTTTPLHDPFRRQLYAIDSMEAHGPSSSSNSEQLQHAAAHSIDAQVNGHYFTSTPSYSASSTRPQPYDVSSMEVRNRSGSGTSGQVEGSTVRQTNVQDDDRHFTTTPQNAASTSVERQGGSDSSLPANPQNAENDISRHDVAFDSFSAEDKNSRNGGETAPLVNGVYGLTEHTANALEDGSSSVATTPERWHAEYIRRARAPSINNFGDVPGGYGQLQPAAVIPPSITLSIEGSITDSAEGSIEGSHNEENNHPISSVPEALSQLHLNEDAFSPSPLLPYKPTPGFRVQIHRNEFNVKPVYQPQSFQVREYPPQRNLIYDLAMEAVFETVRREKREKQASSSSSSDRSSENTPAFAISVDPELKESQDKASKAISRRSILYSGKDDYSKMRGVDLIKPISGLNNTGYEKSGLYLAETGPAFCRICKKHHIPPGAPITLNARDTCGAYLPDWFPKSIPDPWDCYRMMINKLVRLDEILQGYNHPHHARPKSRGNYHKPSVGWRITGRGGGWWICRKDENAPAMERTCDICHGDDDDEEDEDEDSWSSWEPPKNYLGVGKDRTIIPPHEYESRMDKTNEEFHEIIRNEKKDIENLFSVLKKTNEEHEKAFLYFLWERKDASLGGTFF